MDAWLLGILRFSVLSAALWDDKEVQARWDEKLLKDFTATPGHRVQPYKGPPKPNPWKVTPGTLTKYLGEMATIHNERCSNKLYFFSQARNPVFTRESNAATARCVKRESQVSCCTCPVNTTIPTGYLDILRGNSASCICITASLT